MTSLFSMTTTFLQPISLLAALVYAYAVLSRWQRPTRVRSIATGALFGIGMMLSMGSPITLEGGYLFDLRNLVLFCSSAFFGPLVGGVTLAFGVAARISLGGAGMDVGIIAMMMSYMTGIALHWYRNPVEDSGVLYLGFLGLMASTHLMVAPMLDEPFRSFLLFDVGPLFLVLNFAGTVVLGVMLRREYEIAGEARQLRADAELDPLTQILNRRGLEQRASLLKPGYGETGHGVIFLDIDNLRLLNERHGTVAGDKALRFVAQSIKRELRPTDLVGRTGGDEFAIILPEVEADVIKRIARRCLSAVRESAFEFDGVRINLTLSVGVHWGCEMGGLDTLLAAADKALAAAKTSGRDRVAFGRSSGLARPIAA